MRKTTRTSAPTSGSRPLLVAALIVRDEEHMLPDCLASLRGLTDRVVVCDTGSRDRTIEVARAAGAKVIQRDWRDDFGWARNQAIAAAGPARFILSIDADERVQCADPEAVRRTLSQLPTATDVLTVSILNLTLTGEERGRFQAARVFRPDRAQFQGALHEQIVPRPGTHAGARLPLEGLGLLHLGYDQAVVGSRDKEERNLRMAREAWERDPSPSNAFNYARTLRVQNRDRDLQRELLEGLVGFPDLPPRFAAQMLAILAQYDLEEGRPEQAMERAGRGVELVPAEHLAALVYALAAEQLGRDEELAEAARRRRAAPSLDPLIDVAASRARALAREAAARARTGDLDGALADARLAMDAQAAVFDAWDDLAKAVAAERPADAVALLLPLVVTAGGDALDTLVRHLPPGITAELAAALVDAGAATPAAVRTGVLAALLHGRHELLDTLVPAVGTLDTETVAKLAERAAARGFAEVAERLVAAAPRTLSAASPLHEWAGPTAVFFGQQGEEPRLAQAVARCTESLAANGITAVRHLTPTGEAVAQARFGDRGLLPRADARGLVEALRPELIVFTSVARMQADGACAVFHPSARLALLVGASPISESEALDAILGPDDADLDARMVELARRPPAPTRPSIGVAPAGEPVAGLTSVVIPVWNRWDLTSRCLEALAEHTRMPHEIIVVDNGSTDVTPSRLAESPDVRVIRNDSNRGFAAGCNQGIAAARGEFVCLLNNDTEVTPGWLEALHETLAVPGTGAAGPRSNRITGLQAVPRAPSLTDAPDEAHAWARAWVQAHAGRHWLTRRLIGFCLLTHRDVLAKVGALDEGVGMGNYEDDEWCDRLLAVGLDLRVADASVVLHHGSATFQSERLNYVAAARSGARHYAANRHPRGSVLCTALVLGDGRPAPTRRSAQSALTVADRVVVLERGDLTASEVAVAGLSWGVVECRALDWERGDALAAVLAEMPTRQLLVIAAGELVRTDDWGAARAEMEALPAGPATVMLDERRETRVHPPTDEAIARIGGDAGVPLEMLRLTSG